MVRQISARSVSRPIWDRLTDAEFNGEVMAVFRRTCILKVNPCFAMDESEISIIALVLPEIGDGPLNIVLDENSTLNDIQLGQVACFHRDGLHIGGLYVLLKRASIWEPRPNWDQLRSQYETVSRELEFVLSLARRYAPSTSMLELLSPTTYVEASKPPLRECFAAARRGMKALEIGSKRGTNALQIGVSQLAGLGPGLTPSGDDFLAGVMLCLWLSHPTPLGVCRSMLQVAVHRTTLLSAALLQRASMGECNADWHRLSYAIASGNRKRIGVAIKAVLSHGNTSGADTLAGFLWMNQMQHETWSARSRHSRCNAVSVIAST